jgi:hypothetical protein
MIMKWIQTNISTKVRKWTAIILACALLNLTGGCYNYFRIRSSEKPASEAITPLVDAGKTIIIHFNEKKWLLNDIQINNNIISGSIEEYQKTPTIRPLKPNGPNRYLTRASQNQRYLLNEVHLYLDEFAKTENNQVSIPVSSITKIDIYDKDTASTVGSYFLGGVGITSGAILVLAVIVALTKESCPFIYTSDGANYQFAGEIYSGSIHKPLERDDYLQLPTYPDQSNYTLKITNEVREIQHTNLLELQVVDHQGNVTVLADKYGKFHSLNQIIAPSSAVSFDGTDVTRQVTSKDDLFYQSSTAKTDLPQKDGLIMEFPNPGKAQTAKLAIHAKNSIVLDYMIGQFHELFGNIYDKYMERQQKAPEEKMRQWALDQGIPLSLYAERNGNWEFVDYYHIAGPMKFKNDVLQFPLNGNESNPLRLKLEFGHFLWEIDYAAVDYSPDQQFTIFTAPVQTAVTEKQENVAQLISTDDQNYYTQPDTDNQAIVTFNLPEQKNQSRTIFLHSKGWYQILHNPKGKPDIAYLKSFQTPGQFNNFVNAELKKVGEQLNKSGN